MIEAPQRTRNADTATTATVATIDRNARVNRLHLAGHEDLERPLGANEQTLSN